MKDIIKSIISYVILFIIIAMLSYMSYGIYIEERVKTLKADEEEENKILNEELNATIATQTSKQIKKPDIPVDEEYLGYDVSCRLEIPKIKLNTNVLSKYSKEGLDACISKYYGPLPNEVGNYCIAGHNYQKENMFNHIIDLEIGDRIFLTDNKNGIVEYEVYDKYKVKPQNTKPLSQDTQGKREVTLITCVNYSQNRLIIKASER